MPWIKSYTSQLHDPKLRNFTAAEFGIWSKLLLLCGSIGNLIPHDHRYLRAALQLSDYRFRLPLQKFEELGLIEKISASLDKKERKKEQIPQAEGRSRGSVKDPTAPPKNYEEFKKSLNKIGLV